MDVLLRARAFVHAQPDTGLGGRSGRSGESIEGEEVFPLCPLVPQTECGEDISMRSPRSGDRSTWTAAQREAYVRGCTVALERLRWRLQHDLVILRDHPSLAAEERWFRLAERAIRLIAKLSAADRQAGEGFLASPLGEWFYRFQWPTPSPALLAMEAA